ncbi:hypothetical protein F7725_000944 [Dissostichus mawsoni]|uniref:Uncharacterized protein n=1 Tax=Dissostichus mawsoni TaxID=36200 RepID=A0A7J5ZI49_DISMA|nr:hypothetical protein F7725_000944 [Dissostichus mawsoni]
MARPQGHLLKLWSFSHSVVVLEQSRHSFSILHLLPLPLRGSAPAGEPQIRLSYEKRPLRSCEVDQGSAGANIAKCPGMAQRRQVGSEEEGTNARIKILSDFRTSPLLPSVTQTRALSLGTSSRQQADLGAAAGTSGGPSLEGRQTFSNLTHSEALRFTRLLPSQDTAKSQGLTGGQCEWESGKKN